jgi:Cysteine rich repeat
LGPIAWLKQRLSEVSIQRLRDQEARRRITRLSNAMPARQGLALQHTINGYPERKVHMQRIILIAALLCASEAAVAQELTAEQRSACKGDYEKYCKGTTPGGGRIIACLSKSSDKLTAGCKKVLAAAEKK